jgi:hypothetical protein
MYDMNVDVIILGTLHIDEMIYSKENFEKGTRQFTKFSKPRP